MAEEIKTNSAFQEYVTSSAFVLTLSRNQIDALCLVVENDGARLSNMNASALMRRGLIEFKKLELKPMIIDGKQSIRDSYKTTLAGKLTYRLLIEAGLWHSLEHPMEVCPIDCTQEEWDAVKLEDISV